MTRTTYKGFTFDQRTADMLREVDRLTPTIPVLFAQGSYSNGSLSAGTHSGGGAVDIDAQSLSSDQRATLVEVLREVGFAAWLRTPAQGFTWHVHGIAKGCPDLSPAARAQVVQFYGGLDGLAGRGRDDGPRTYTSATWESYVASKEKQTVAPRIVRNAAGTGLLLQDTTGRQHPLLTQEEVAIASRWVQVMGQMNAREQDVVGVLLTR